MTVAYRSSAYAFTTTTALSITKPAGQVEGDVVVLLININGLSTPTWPTGFTEIFSSVGKYIAAAWKTAGPTEPATYGITLSSAPNRAHGYAVAVSGAVSVGDPIGAYSQRHYSATSNLVSALGVETDRAGLLLGNFALWDSSVSYTPPTGMIEALDNFNSLLSTELTYESLTGPTSTGYRDARVSATVDRIRQAALVFVSENLPPNAPNQLFPIVGEAINGGVSNALTWTFSDPDTGDSQSRYDLQIRLQGSSTNTVDTNSTTTNEFYSLPASALTEGNWEWRVRTYDSQGAIGAWTGWEPFRVNLTPDTPTITAPVTPFIISADSALVTWSVPDQDSYQLRKVADAAGSPVTTTVYYDTGTVASSSTRGRTVDFPTNGRFEHIQMRVYEGGLWSGWASIRVSVSYTAPRVPLMIVTEREASLYLETRRNLVPSSGDLSTWPTTNATNVGGVITDTATSGQHYAAITITDTFLPIGDWCAYVDIEPLTATKTDVMIRSLSSLYPAAQFDFAAGAAYLAGGGAKTCGMFEVKPGAYRCWLVFDSGAGTSMSFFVRLRNAAGSTSYLGDGTISLKAHRAQLTPGTEPLDYTATTGAEPTTTAHDLYRRKRSTNLLTLEQAKGTGGWEPVAAASVTYVRDEDSPTGYAVRLLSRAAWAGCVTTEACPVVGGREYRLTAYAKWESVPSGSQLHLYVRWYDATGAQISTSTVSAVNVYAGYLYLPHLYAKVAPLNAVSAKMAIYSATLTSPPAAFRVAGAQIEEGSTETEFVLPFTDDEIRIAASIDEFEDWAVASGVDYEYRPKALGDNGTSTLGEWTA